MWEVILFFAEGLTAAELGAYSPGFFPAPGSSLVLGAPDIREQSGTDAIIDTVRSPKAILGHFLLQKQD